MEELKEFNKFKTYFDGMPKNAYDIAYVNFTLNKDDAYNVVDDLIATNMSADVTMAVGYSKLAMFTKEEMAMIKNEEYLANLNDPVKLRTIAIMALKKLSENIGMGVTK